MYKSDTSVQICNWVFYSSVFLRKITNERKRYFLDLNLCGTFWEYRDSMRVLRERLKLFVQPWSSVDTIVDYEMRTYLVLLRNERSMIIRARRSYYNYNFKDNVGNEETKKLDTESNWKRYSDW